MNGLWISVRGDGVPEQRCVVASPRRCVMFARPRGQRLVPAPVSPVPRRELRS